jgi:uncharacterized protein (DUF983 family)
MCPRCGVAIMAEHDAAEGSRQTVTVLMVGMVVAMAALGVAIF